ncbi:hypothetical protein RS674_05125, partial [Bifidobacterium longum]|nr:hypothetical protein [Bifidobacterium longum]
MDTTSLFTAALQLPDPWRVSGVEFRDEEDGRRELHIAIGFAAGSRFPCPEPGCGEAACPVHDARERVWRCISSSRCFVFSHVFFSGLGSCMHFPYFSGCAEVFLP